MEAGIVITNTGGADGGWMNMNSVTSTAMKIRGTVSPAVFRAVIYIVAFVTGAIVMSFETLGSRYLNPYFGNGIYTWAALISTVLAALSAGHFLGGFMPIARYPHEVCAAPSAAPPQPHPGERPGGARPKKRASGGPSLHSV
jgi:hypothetical protein